MEVIGRKIRGVEIEIRDMYFNDRAIAETAADNIARSMDEHLLFFKNFFKKHAKIIVIIKTGSFLSHGVRMRYEAYVNPEQIFKGIPVCYIDGNTALRYPTCNAAIDHEVTHMKHLLASEFFRIRNLALRRMKRELYKVRTDIPDGFKLLRLLFSELPGLIVLEGLARYVEFLPYLEQDYNDTINILVADGKRDAHRIETEIEYFIKNEIDSPHVKEIFTALKEKVTDHVYFTGAGIIATIASKTRLGINDIIKIHPHNILKMHEKLGGEVIAAVGGPWDTGTGIININRLLKLATAKYNQLYRR